MNPFSVALEDMASRFKATSEMKPDIETIERWKNLFYFADPYSTIIQYREDLNRLTVSDDHWELIRGEKEAEGYDRESYEYSLTLRSKSKPKATITSTANRGQYLLQLQPMCPTIASPVAVQNFIGLDATPEREIAEDGSEFVRLSCAVKVELETALSERYPTIRPLFVRLTLPAEKALYPTSLYPTLGIDSTLPHYRINSAEDLCLVQQEQFPVWYFFYGTLGDETVLRRVLGNDNAVIIYYAAKVQNAALTTWGGRYMGLVDGKGVVEGYAYLVESEDDEHKLRHYETDNYEVVRCEIGMASGARQGLTFRYVEPA